MKTLNPGYKFLTLLVASLMLSLSYKTQLNALVFLLSVAATALTPSVSKKRLLIACVPFFLAALGLFASGLLFPSGGGEGVAASAFGQRTIYATSLASALVLASRVLAFGGIGMLFAFTTDAMAFIMSLMQQFRLPPKFAYGILAAYHFFPVVRSEYAIVGAALKVRGIRAGPFSPRRIFPMLVHAMERSESLAMAMESRGFEGSAPRGVAFRTPLRARDFVFLFCTVAGMAAGIAFL